MMACPVIVVRACTSTAKDRIKTNKTYDHVVRIAKIWDIEKEKDELAVRLLAQ